MFNNLIILDPGSWFLPIPDPGSNKINKREGWKNTFFGSHRFHKIENYFIFKMHKKKIWASFQRFIELFTQKFVTHALKNMGLGSEIRDPEKNLSLIRVQGSKRYWISDPWSRSATLLTYIFYEGVDSFYCVCVSLIAERTRLAASVSLPAYMVVSEQSLLQLAEMRPTLPASLARIQVVQKPQLSLFRKVLRSPKSIYFMAELQRF